MARRKKDRLFQFSLRGLDTNLLVVLFFIMIFGFIKATMREVGYIQVLY